MIAALLPWPFDRSYLQLALLSGVVVGAVAPLVGGFLVQRRMSLLGDGIGHVAFAGVAAGLLAGIWPIWTALAAAVVAALGIEWLRARGGTSGERDAAAEGADIANRDVRDVAHRLREQRLPPERGQAARVEVPRMERPEPHQRSPPTSSNTPISISDSASAAQAAA